MAHPTSPTGDNASSSPSAFSDAWKSNELILDAIFSLLPIRDLANVRLTGKLWSAVAARTLTKKAVVQLTDWTFAGRQVATDFSSAFHYPYDEYPGLSVRDDMWKCACEVRGNKTTRYFSIDHQQQQLSRVAAADTEFRPKKVVTLGYSAARRLAQVAQFQWVRELELVAYTGQQGADMLHNVSTWFPQLETLRFREIIPGDNSQQETCVLNDAFCRPFLQQMSKDYRLGVFATKRHLSSTDGVYNSPRALCSSNSKEAQGATSAHQQLNNKKLSSNLRELSIEISPHCRDRDWAILASFPKLEALQVLWWEKNPITASTWTRDSENTCYPECLENMLTYMPVTTSLKQLVLRISVFWSDIARIQTALNELQVARVSLQIICPQGPRPRGVVEQGLDGWSQQSAALITLVSGLVDRVCQNLHTLSLYVSVNETPSLDLLSLFSELARKTFFQKPTWNCVIQSIDCGADGSNNGWIRFRKIHPKSFTFQLTHQASWVWSLVYSKFEYLVAAMIPDAQQYNYAFHRVDSINDFENLNSSALFRPYFLTAHWTGMKYLVCGDCRDYPRLLCDLPGFREEAQLSLPEEHPEEEFVRTWTFAAVPRHLLAKWAVQLVSEISAWRETSKCACIWSDVVSRFKKIYAFQFTDKDCAQADHDEPQGIYRKQRGIVFEPTLASHGNGFCAQRYHIFLARRQRNLQFHL